jgi:hypothetical protein
VPVIGKKTARALRNAKIRTINDLAALPDDQQMKVWEQLTAELPDMKLAWFRCLVKRASALGAGFDLKTVKGIFPK